MASAPNAARLCLSARQRAPRPQTLCRRAPPRTTIRSRPLSTTTPSLQKNDVNPSSRSETDDAAENEDQTAEIYEFKKMNKLLSEGNTVESLRMLDQVAKTGGHISLDRQLDSHFYNNYEYAAQQRAQWDLLKAVDKPKQRPDKNAFWFDEDDPDTVTEEHDEFDEDDITHMAHGKLDEIREMRHYARLAVWEMPLLSKLAKPYEKPTDNQVLRWRYTTYMGEAHPAEKKVVVQFAPDDLKLTPVQTSKLKKLAGPRYKPDKELIHMSCESFEHQAQNKWYLSKLVEDLVAAAKDPSDTFEDLPLDLRHHRPSSSSSSSSSNKANKKPRFPMEWRMTEERRLQLDEQRAALAAEDLARKQQGLLVNGQQIVDAHRERMLAEEQRKQAEQQQRLEMKKQQQQQPAMEAVFAGGMRGRSAGRDRLRRCLGGGVGHV